MSPNPPFDWESGAYRALVMEHRAPPRHLTTDEQAALKRALMRSVVILPERCPWDRFKPARDVA